MYSSKVWLIRRFGWVTWSHDSVQKKTGLVQISEILACLGTEFQVFASRLQLQGVYQKLYPIGGTHTIPILQGILDPFWIGSGMGVFLGMGVPCPWGFFWNFPWTKVFISWGNWPFHWGRMLPVGWWKRLKDSEWNTRTPRANSWWPGPFFWVASLQLGERKTYGEWRFWDPNFCFLWFLIFLWCFFLWSRFPWRRNRFLQTFGKAGANGSRDRSSGYLKSLTIIGSDKGSYPQGFDQHILVYSLVYLF